MVVFWLLLQFSRALRAVREAARAPVGSVRSAVMLNARLKAGMTMAQVLALTRSLGVRVETPAGAERARNGGAGRTQACRSRLAFVSGRLVRWELHRPPEEV